MNTSLRKCCQTCLRKLWDLATMILKIEQVIRDVERQRTRDPRNVTAIDFLREIAWSIYSIQGRFPVMERKWPEISKVFFDWDCVKIAENASLVRRRALQPGLRVRFSERKVDAIITIACLIRDVGWPNIQKRVLQGLRVEGKNILPGDELIQWLDTLPMVGCTVALYIAKNLGFDVAKDDMWLRRIAKNFGYVNASGEADCHCVQKFIADISRLVDERISVVETVLWNAASQGIPLSFTCPCCGARR